MFRRYPTHQMVNYCDWASWYFATGYPGMAALLVRCSAHLIERCYREAC